MAWTGTRPEDFTNDVSNSITNIMHRQALEILGGVIPLTPVDTGRLRGNWQVGVNSAPSGADVADKNGDSTFSKGSSVISAFKFDPKRSNNYIIIANNLDYAIYVEANFGMLRSATSRVLR